MKKLPFVFIILMSFNFAAQTQFEKEEKIRLEIRVQFDKVISKCRNSIDVVTDFNGKIEFWSICSLENKNRIITISSYKNSTYFKEIYFEQNGKLIYAIESEDLLPKNHFTQMSWNCEFFIKDTQLVTTMSLGHGKTEDENWNPESIFSMYKKRISELSKIKK